MASRHSLLIASRHSLLMAGRHSLLMVFGSLVPMTVCQLIQIVLSYRTLEDACTPLHKGWVESTLLPTQSPGIFQSVKPVQMQTCCEIRHTSSLWGGALRLLHDSWAVDGFHSSSSSMPMPTESSPQEGSQMTLGRWLNGRVFAWCVRGLVFSRTTANKHLEMEGGLHKTEILQLRDCLCKSKHSAAHLRPWALLARAWLFQQAAM